MGKRKRAKRQATIYKTLHNAKDRERRTPQKNPGWTQVPTSDIRRVTLATNPVISYE